MTDRLLPVIVTCAVLLSLESIIPLYRFRGSRLRHALPNLALAAVVFAMNATLAFLSARLSAFVVAHGIGLLFLVELPLWAQAIAGIAALDLFAWLAHLALHRSALGWRFHRVHHSEDTVDVTTAFRQHPGETVWRICCQLPAIVMVGIPPWIIVAYLTVSAVNAQLEHANIAMGERLDRVVRLLFVTPDMHKVHHSRLQPETDSNYANVFSVWDRLFRTYTARVDYASLRYGLDGIEERETNRVLGLLAMPFRRSVAR
jgi:sterol desaturase/sphingolipid hydroxylase (fatty acid hydroxylase superfamily)